MCTKRQYKPAPTNRRPKEEYDHLPFTKMLRPTDKSKFRTRELIRDYLLQASIPFEFFSKKPIKQTGKNHNPDGFNGAVAAMIHVYRKLELIRQAREKGEEAKELKKKARKIYK